MRNCIQCSSATACTTCRKGFALTADNKCRGCSASCSDCLSTDITSCTECAVGLELLNSACVSCPKNCDRCSNGVCG